MDRGESERWLGISAKLLAARDFLGSRTFAIRAKESDPNNSLSDQILAVVDTVLSGEKRVGTTQQPDWYGVLQLPKLVRDGDLISNHYRRLVMLLSPERNRLPFADYALRIVMDAWSVLSDPTKKWLFDNELALDLQNCQVDPNGGAAASGSGSGSGSGSVQLNTFEFFQPVPAPQQQQGGRSQSNPAATLQMQQQIRSQTRPDASLQMWQQQAVPQMQSAEAVVTPQVVQREFIPGLATQMPAQWQLRDLNPNVNASPNVSVSPSLNPKVTAEPAQTPWVARSGGGDLNPSMNTNPNVNVSPSPNPKVAEPAQAPWVARSDGGVQVAPTPAPAPAPVPEPVPVPVVTATEDENGNVDGGVNNNNNSNSNNNNNYYYYNGVGGNNVNVDGNKGNDGGGGGEERVESFWTACPYCFYIYEYQKEYQDCTLRCQNCRRGFHALPVPNPPPVGPVSGEKGKGEGKEGEESSFCCWGFFPLGFSMVAWKKQSRNGSGNWVPFSPMFASPNGNGGGSFHWFANDGNGTPVGGGRTAHVSAPRVYIDDDGDVLDVTDSGGDSSDRDWRNPGKRKNKGQVGGGKRGRGRPKKADKFNQEVQNSVGETVATLAREDVQKVGEGKRGRGRPKKADKFNQEIHNSVGKAAVTVAREDVEKVGGGKRGRGRPRKADKVNQQVQNLAGEATVTVARGDMENGPESLQVVGLVAGKKTDTNKTPASTVMRKQTRRTMKDRLDLNVEFNNEGDEHAPTVSAVNGDEDGIENIGFFEGLDEFFSTLPILNVGGDEKAKPS